MKKKISSLALLLFFLSLWGCAAISEMTAPKAKVTSGGGPSMAEAQMEAYNGPKARIAVSRFTDKTGKGWWTGAIGDGMADMLATALFNTNRFIVLERQTLQDVLVEQDLGAAGRIRGETAAPIGQIEGAELLVAGAVTEFEPGSSGVGGGIGGGSWGSVVGGVLGAIQKSHVAIDLRVIDTKTSRIIAAASVEGEATDFSLGGLLLGSNVGGGLGGYSKTPIEKAIRVALGEAINFVVSRTPQQYYHYTDSSSTGPGSTPRTSATETPEEPYQAFSSPKTMYVKGTKANIRGGAGKGYNIVTTVEMGESLTTIGKKGSWYHVRLGNGREGYIYQDLITTTKPASTEAPEPEEAPSVM